MERGRTLAPIAEMAKRELWQESSDRKSSPAADQSPTSPAPGAQTRGDEDCLRDNRDLLGELEPVGPLGSIQGQEDAWKIRTNWLIISFGEFFPDWGR